MKVRKKNPIECTSAEKLDERFSGLGGSEQIDKARNGTRSQCEAVAPVHATVTIGSRKRSCWLSPYIRWVQFRELTLQWRREIVRS
eukprot:767895-Hanusia_phi.AAC.7